MIQVPNLFAISKVIDHLQVHSFGERGFSQPFEYNGLVNDIVTSMIAAGRVREDTV